MKVIIGICLYILFEYVYPTALNASFLYKLKVSKIMTQLNDLVLALERAVIKLWIPFDLCNLR